MKYIYLVVVLALTGLSAHSAPIIDNFDSLTQIRVLNPTSLQVAIDSDNLEATLLQSGFQGFTWSLPGLTVNPWDAGAGAFAFSLGSADQQFVFELNGIAPIDTAASATPAWSISVFLYDSDDTFIPTEQLLQFDTTATGYVAYDLQAWQASLPAQYQTAAKWIPVMQIVSSDIGDGFSFDQFSATTVPEPSTLSVLVFAVATTLLARRR